MEFTLGREKKVVTLEPDEVEMLLRFPRNHTMGGGIGRTDIYKSHGNSFQVKISYFLMLISIFPPFVYIVTALFQKTN